MKYYLLFIVCGSLLLEGCQSLSNNLSSTSVSQTTPVALADPTTLTTIEENVHQQINQYRQSRKLSSLTFNNTIAQQARIHSERMAAKTVTFSHEGFEKRLQQIKITIPYQQAAENVAYNQGSKDPATAAVQGWLKSPGHLKNIEGNFNLTGVGVSQNTKGQYYFTQIFIKPSLASTSSVPSSPNSSKVSNPTNSNSLIILEQATHQQINQYRQSQNLPPLLLDARISDEARQFSQKMAKKEAPFSHDGFDGRVKGIGKSIRFQSVGENLAFNMGYSDPVTVAVQGWIKSPGHRKNMVGDFELTGIGIAKNPKGEYYFTQLFVKKR